MTDYTRPSRPRSLEAMSEIQKQIFDSGDEAPEANFQPRPTDVIITPYAKSGTTWLQQIAHGLRTRGSMDFDEITAVTPWIEMANRVGWDVNAEQVANPRLYKSHNNWYDIPKGAKYIVSIRHPHDMHVSLYRFFEGWFFEPGTIEIGEFIYSRCKREDMDEKGYWHHLSSWWEQRNNEKVLILCYEDMKADLPTTIETIAKFIGIDLDDDLREIVLRQSSREFMLEHKDHFDDKYMHHLTTKDNLLPPAISSHKITAGANHPRYQLPDDVKAYLDELWQEHITPKFGLDSYDDLRREIQTLYSG